MLLLLINDIEGWEMVLLVNFTNLMLSLYSELEIDSVVLEMFN